MFDKEETRKTLTTKFNMESVKKVMLGKSFLPSFLQIFLKKAEKHYLEYKVSMS